MTNLFDVDWSKFPVPSDDGGAKHLAGVSLPALALPATDGSSIDLSELSGRTVAYIYPKAGRPGAALPDGWDSIPGARGCTPQACAFRDNFAELKLRGANHVFGISTQTTPEQQEAAERLHLQFPLLSDERFALTDAMHLPTFEAQEVRLLRRLTMIIDDGRIAHVFYPIPRPDKNAQDVIDWLSTNAR